MLDFIMNGAHPSIRSPRGSIEMDISRIRQASLPFIATASISPQEAGGKTPLADNVTFSLSSSPEPSSSTLPSTLFQVDAKGKAGNQGETSVYCFTSDGVQTLARQSDGGILVDGETKTVAYYGDAAKMLLERTSDFDRETEVILPSHCALTVDHQGERLSISEPGAILIGPGANVQVAAEGNPLVIQTEKPPSWYTKMGPNGEHKDDFDAIASLNRRLLRCLTNKSIFKVNDLNQLLSCGILLPDKDDRRFVAWAPFKTHDELISKLIEAGFKGNSIDEIDKIWEKALRRKLYGLEIGHFPRKRLTREQLKKLTSHGVIKDNGGSDKRVYWTEIANEEHIKVRIASAGLKGKDFDDVLDIWRATTKSGYDNTGLCWDKGKVLAYILRDKQNVWNEQDTEWIVNSTEYAGDNKPFTVGVSTVAAKKTCIEPVDFKELRPGEGLHQHPVRDDKRQTEAYLVTGGTAAILTLCKGKPQITYLNAGDMAVINPGVTHAVIAADGPYEHLCFQIPSAFQYGFLFKDIQQYESFSLNEERLVEAAKKGLAEGKKGTFDI
jgi:hypothetical protein